MPVYEKSPFSTMWNTINEETGENYDKVLSIDDILKDIALGDTITDLCEKHKAPVAAIQHLISCLPEMMVWREGMGSPPEGILPEGLS